MPYTYSQGNVDTESGGSGQMILSPSGSTALGNLDSERSIAIPATGTGSLDINALLSRLNLSPAQQPVQGYEQIGAALNQMIQLLQNQQTGQSGGGGSLNSMSLTSGFDQDWLGARLSAGSANGQKIGGITGGGGGGKKEEDDTGGDDTGPGGYFGEGGFGPTVKNGDPSTMKGAGRLMKGGWFKNLFTGGGDMGAAAGGVRGGGPSGIYYDLGGGGLGGGYSWGPGLSS